MSSKLPVYIQFRNGPPIREGASVEDVIAVMGSPSEQWDDGVEAYLGYYFLTHEISFSFSVVRKDTSLTACEVTVQHKLPRIDSYDVITTSENGDLRKTDVGLSFSEATKRMAAANHSRGIASHWISPSSSLIKDGDTGTLV